jgi:hypothetical protein
MGDIFKSISDVIRGKQRLDHVLEKPIELAMPKVKKSRGRSKGTSKRIPSSGELKKKMKKKGNGKKK